MRVVICSAFLLLTLSCAAPGEAPADLVLRGGQIVTMDATIGTVEALAARDGVVIAIGTDAEMMATVVGQMRNQPLDHDHGDQ